MSVGDKRRWREGRQMFKLHCLVNIDNSQRLLYFGLVYYCDIIITYWLTVGWRQWPLRLPHVR